MSSASGTVVRAELLDIFSKYWMIASSVVRSIYDHESAFGYLSLATNASTN